jgi:D-glycero-alpha-D-manno-heptose-7-phosphate kinase
MLISKAPLRISFVGGGTDLPEVSDNIVGRVVSTTINKYVYVMINGRSKLEDNYRISYKYKTEYADSIHTIEHNLVRECLKYFAELGYTEPLEIVSMADLPGRGTGLGSSSSFTVALLEGLSAYFQSPLTNTPEIAYQIERKYSNLGRQDQYIASLRGVNRLDFSGISVRKTQLEMKPSFTNKMFLRYTGKDSLCGNEILHSQSAKVADYLWKYKELAELAYIFYLEWNSREVKWDSNYLTDYNYLYELIERSWEIKQTLCGAISSPYINHIMDALRDNGCRGLKLLGSGGGGFIMGFSDDKVKLQEDCPGVYLFYIATTGKSAVTIL